MNASINEKYFQPTVFRNDIFRKFEKQFVSCFLNTVNIDDTLYVEQPTDVYSNDFNVFLDSLNSGIKFFVGYTGVGKTTFLKHYFNYKTMGFVKYKKDGIVIPACWDGRKIPDNNFDITIEKQICNILDNLISELYKSFEYIILDEGEELLNFIKNTRSDVITSLTIDEIIQAKNAGISIEQAKLQKSKDEDPVPFSSSVLKYVLEKHCPDIKRLVFVVDDLETLAQHKLCYLITTYLNIYDCMHNSASKPIVNLIFSLRPHSFRFLKDNIDHKYINGYGNILDNESCRIVKNEIPDVKEILIRRFKDAFNRTEKPGNPETWDIAKKTFFEIITSLDENIIKTISEICHLNIRAIIDCLQMILSNRVWCQDSNDYSDHPTVKVTDYRFNIVNVVRTLACGESSVYTGKKDIKFNPQNVSNVLSRPQFDDSDIFIPNILIDIKTKECDILPIIIMQYLEGYFSSQIATPPQTEFISKTVLCDTFRKLFGEFITVEKINRTIEYLFDNRIIRKSIISKDTDNTINKLLEQDYIYLTLKGSRLLSMFENDSVLLETFREDVRRNYENRSFCYKSSFELITQGERNTLFNDLVDLVQEVYYSEDDYQNHIADSEVMSFYKLDFPISQKLLMGVEKSLLRSQSIDAEIKKTLLHKIKELKNQIAKRIIETNKLN